VLIRVAYRITMQLMNILKKNLLSHIFIEISLIKNLLEDIIYLGIYIITTDQHL